MKKGGKTHYAQVRSKDPLHSHPYHDPRAETRISAEEIACYAYADHENESSEQSDRSDLASVSAWIVSDPETHETPRFLSRPPQSTRQTPKSKQREFFVSRPSEKGWEPKNPRST